MFIQFIPPNYLWKTIGFDFSGLDQRPDTAQAWADPMKHPAMFKAAMFGTWRAVTPESGFSGAGNS
jgi:hypothetical protein